MQKLLVSFLFIYFSLHPMDHHPATQRQIAKISNYLDMWLLNVSAIQDHDHFYNRIETLAKEKKRIVLQLYCLQRIVGSFMNDWYLKELEEPMILRRTQNSEISNQEDLLRGELYGNEHGNLSRDTEAEHLVLAWPQKEHALNTQLKALYALHVDSFAISSQKK